MADINDLRRNRKAAADKMQAAADKLTDLEAVEETTEEQLAEATKEFEAADAEFKRADAAVKRAEQVEAAQAEAAAPSEPSQPAGGAGAGNGARAPAAAAEPGLRFGAMLRTLGAVGGDYRAAIDLAEANGQSGLFTANQNVTTGTAGGLLVPDDVANEVIELLRPNTVVMSMGVRVVPMPNGNLTQNRRKTGATFGYGEENDDVTKTGYTYGQMKLSAKKLSGLVPISNDLLQFSSTAVDRMIRDDALADAGVAMDLNFLRGSGVQSGPLGLRFQLVGTDAEASNILTMTAAPDLQKIDNDLGRMELALSNGNVQMTGAHWIMSPRTANFLRNLRDGNGNKVYPEMSDGRLRNKPVHETTSQPDNLGDGGDESEMMLVHPQHVVVGEANGIRIAMSTEAAYKDENGTMQSSFSRDETLMRMIMQHDIGLRHLVAVAVMKGLTWGA